MIPIRRATFGAAAIFAAMVLAAPMTRAEAEKPAPAAPKPAEVAPEKEPNAPDAKTGPMATMVAAYAQDGILLVDTGKETPFTLLIADGDYQKTKSQDGQIMVSTGDRLFQQVLVLVKDFWTKPHTAGDARAILAGHAAWEMRQHNELTHQNLSPNLEFVKLGGVEWAYFKYDLAGYIKEQEAEGKLKPGEATAVCQHLATTLVGDKVLLLATTEMTGDTADATRKALLDNAATLKRYEQPLTREDITAICKGEKK